MTNIEQSIWNYITVMNRLGEKHQLEQFPNNPGLRSHFSMVDGRKYVKILTHYNDGTSKSVHAFIDKTTGDLYKAASRNAPAKGVRYNLLTDLPRIEQTADVYGAYLYKNTIR
jgi:predicted metal-dependent phosphoesterase TrpH